MGACCIAIGVHAHRRYSIAWRAQRRAMDPNGQQAGGRPGRLRWTGGHLGRPGGRYATGGHKPYLY
jgi:hypothetical protein